MCVSMSPFTCGRRVKFAHLCMCVGDVSVRVGIGGGGFGGVFSRCKTLPLLTLIPLSRLNLLVFSA